MSTFFRYAPMFLIEPLSRSFLNIRFRTNHHLIHSLYLEKAVIFVRQRKFAKFRLGLFPSFIYCIIRA